MVISEKQFGGISILHYIDLDIYRSGAVGVEALQKALHTKVVSNGEVKIFKGIVDYDELKYKN